jgi:hypothetical protein
LGHLSSLSATVVRRYSQMTLRFPARVLLLACFDAGAVIRSVRVMMALGEREIVTDNAPSTDELLIRAREVLGNVLDDAVRNRSDEALISRRSVIVRLIDDIDVRRAFDEARKAAL